MSAPDKWNRTQTKVEEAIHQPLHLGTLSANETMFHAQISYI